MLLKNHILSYLVNFYMTDPQLFLKTNLNFFILNKFLVYEEYISLQFSFVFLIISNINYKELNIYEFIFIYTYISIL